MQQRNNHAHGKKCIMDVGWVGRVGVLADYREIPADLGDTGFSIVKLRQRVSHMLYAWSESQFWGMYRKYGKISQHQHCQNLLTSVYNTHISVCTKLISSIVMPFFITVCGSYHPALFESFLCCFSYD